MRLHCTISQPWAVSSSSTRERNQLKLIYHCDLFQKEFASTFASGQQSSSRQFSETYACKECVVPTSFSIWLVWVAYNNTEMQE